MKKIICFLIICISVFSVTIQSSNGNITLSYDTEKNILKNLSLTVNEDKIDIENIEMGIWTDNILYNLKDHVDKVEVIEGTNIIRITGNIENKYEYIVKVYSSMVSKSRVVIDAEIKNQKNESNKKIDFYYYVKPVENYRDINFVNKYYSYGNIFFKNLTNSMKLYLTNDIYIEQLKFFPFVKGLKKRKDLAFFFLSELQETNGIYKDIFVLSGEEADFIVDMVDYKKEIEFWTDFFKDIKDSDFKKPLVELKSYQKRDGSIYNFYLKNGVIKVKDVIYASEAFLRYGFEDEGRRGIRYLLNSITIDKFEKYGEYIISNYGYNFDRKEVLKSDNYGEMFNPINSSLFLILYTNYFFETGDKKFIEQNYDLIEKKVAGYLLDLVDEEGVIENSGDSRIGKEGMKRFIETQKKIYDSFGNYIELLKILNLDSEKYEEARKRIRESIILNYIKDDKILDYPSSTDAKWTNIYCAELEFFRNINEYYRFLQTNLNRVSKYKDRSLEEQVEFVNFLYNKRYTLMALDRKNSLVGRINRGENNSVYEMQKSIEFTAKYLIMLKKGDKNGDSL